MSARRWTFAGALSTLAVAACLYNPSPHTTRPPVPSAGPTAPAVDSALPGHQTLPPAPFGLLPGMPPITNPHDIYAADRAGALSPIVAGFRSLLYVPNSANDSVDEIDPATGALVRHLRVGQHPQHIVPSYDLTTLWVLNELSNTLTALDPHEGSPGRTVPVTDPHNMYFTPDGHYALVVEDANQTLTFRDPYTMKLVHRLPITCPGVDELDFTADGRYAIATCALAGRLVKIDVARQQVMGYLRLGPNTSPQDIKTSPDGTAMYVADRFRGGVWQINPTAFSVLGFLQTGQEAHGLILSRDSRRLYVTNRSGSVSVLSLAAHVMTHRWRIPGGAPDLGGLSADGTILWLTSHSHPEIYALDTRTGHLTNRIPLTAQPHGLAVYPQPGRYCLGHTGVFR